MLYAGLSSGMVPLGMHLDGLGGSVAVFQRQLSGSPYKLLAISPTYRAENRPECGAAEEPWMVVVYPIYG